MGPEAAPKNLTDAEPRCMDGGGAICAVAARGVESNDKRRYALAERGCATGSRASCEIKWIAQSKGYGTKADAKGARAAATAACDAKDPHGCYALAVMYEVLFHAENKDNVRAIEKYTWACENGYGRACYDLAVIATSGRGDTPKDLKRAMEHHKRACSLKFKTSCLKISTLAKQIAAP